MDKPEGPNWIPASEAVRLLQNQFGSPLTAKQVIADCLKSGLLRSQADLTWQTRSPRSPHLLELPVPPQTEIAANLWKTSQNWTTDQDAWDWELGIFCVSYMRGPETEWTMVLGLSFSADQIKGLKSGRSLGSRRGIGGVGKREAAWTAFWHALLELALDGRLRNFENQTELRTELLLLMNGGLEDGTIKPKVSQVWKRFVAPHK